MPKISLLAVLLRAYAQLNACGRGGLTRITARGNDGSEQVFIVPTTVLQQQVRTGRPRPSAPTRQPCATVVLTPEDLLLGATGRRYDPNMPPSYDQAVSGQDKSIKIEEGKSGISVNVPSTEPPPEYAPEHPGDDEQPLLP